MSKPTDLVQGTLDLLILKIIALEPMHGWAIAQRIRQVSSDVLQVGKARCIPRCTNWNAKGGSNRSGTFPKPTAKPSSTR
jgi:hypothetical protein